MLDVQEMPIGDVIPYENNPRKNDKAVDAVAESIREFGFKVPIIVDKENVIVAGHTRLRAAEKLGLSTVPVIRADDLTEEQITAFRLADNKTSELAEWDFEKLAAELELNSIPYGINTNFNVLKYFKPDYLKVSLDGYDEESYASIRKVRAYEKVRENIKAYARWKKENSPNTNLGIQAIVDDPGTVLSFYEANKDLPVDYIVFRPMESTGGEYYEDRMGEAKKAISLINMLAEADSRVVLNFKWYLLQERFENCVAHWAQIALDEKGNVIYCCHKPYERIGHIMDDDILVKYADAKTNMSMCDVPCRMTAPNLFMETVKGPAMNTAFI